MSRDIQELMLKKIHRAHPSIFVYTYISTQQLLDGRKKGNKKTTIITSTINVVIVVDSDDDDDCNEIEKKLEGKYAKHLE